MPIYNPPQATLTETEVATIVDNKIAALPAPAAGGDGYTELYNYTSPGSNSTVSDITVDVTGYSEIIIVFALTPYGDVPTSTTALPILTFNSDAGANYNLTAYTNDTGTTAYSAVNFIRVGRTFGTGVFTANVDILLVGKNNTVKVDANMGVVNGSTRAGTVNGSWNPPTPVEVTSITIGELNNNFLVGSDSTIIIKAK